MLRFWLGACLILSLFCLSCGKIEIKGKAQGTKNSSRNDIYELNLSRGSLDTVGNERVVRYNGTQDTELFDNFTTQLNIQITGNPNNLPENYLFINTFHPENGLFGGTSEDRSFVVNSLDHSIFQRIRRGENSQEVRINSKNHLGFGYLAVVDDGDRVIPWKIEPGQTNCVSLGNPQDCLDMETISRDMFNSVSNGVRRAVRNTAPTLSVQIDDLFFVPNVIQNSFENEGRRARGFGFVYHAWVQAPLTRIDVYVPLSFIFADDVQDYRLFIDPISLRSPTSPNPQNIKRIMVIGSPGANLFEGTIRNAIVEAMDELELPTVPGNVAFEDFVHLGINTASGRNADLTGSPPHTSPTYNFFLAPEETQNELTTLRMWTRGRGVEIEEKTKVRLHIIE